MVRHASKTIIVTIGCVAAIKKTYFYFNGRFWLDLKNPARFDQNRNQRFFFSKKLLDRNNFWKNNFAQKINL